MEDSENAISNDLQTPYFQHFSAQHQLRWRLPKAKSHVRMFSKVGYYDRVV